MATDGFEKPQRQTLDEIIAVNARPMSWLASTESGFFRKS
jgi:hypothetical protein